MGQFWNSFVPSRRDVREVERMNVLRAKYERLGDRELEAVAADASEVAPFVAAVAVNRKPCTRPGDVRCSTPRRAGINPWKRG